MSKRKDLKLRIEPIKREDIPKPTREDRELMLLWNLRLFPFIINNYDVIFKGRKKKSTFV